MRPTSADAGMRAFGHVADLDLDLRSSDRPQLVTALLAQCGGRDDASFWWSRPVGVRIAALLRLVAMTDACKDVALSARCAVPACGELFDFVLPLAALAAHAGDEAPIAVVLDPGRAATLRRPTGEDLRRWREADPPSREAAVRAMLDALALEGGLSVEDEPAVAAALAAADPLVDFTVACRCPACGAQTEVAIDLEDLALRRLGARQRSLVAVVHRLASQYGWTEAQVLAVPASRRARYLELIEEER